MKLHQATGRTRPCIDGENAGQDIRYRAEWWLHQRSMRVRGTHLGELRIFTTHGNMNEARLKHRAPIMRTEASTTIRRTKWKLTIMLYSR